MPESREPNVESSAGGRVRFLLLGLIIGASTIVLLTNNDVSFGTASVIEHAMPPSPATPGAIFSAALPRNVLPPAADSARIPEIDVSRLPKAESAAPAGSGAKRGAKPKKKGEADADDKKAVRAPAAAPEEPSELGGAIDMVLDGLQGFGKAFKNN